jgi:hypothetical protein
MKITPLAVFTSNLSSENAREIITADVEMMHPNKIVQDAIFCYCKSIHYLLNNPTDEDRADNAFKYALSISQTFPSGDTVYNWLLLSDRMNKVALEAKVLVLDPLP